ncbi:hypothetical protein E0F15_17530, partial [Frankia sp. B2]
MAAAPPVPPVTVPSVPSVPSVPPVTVPSAAPATVGSQPATAGIAQPATAEPPAGVDVSVIESAVAEVVAEKTGYPVDVLEPSMALESDLGVDSIKRVQILGSLQERFPGVPAVGPERAAEMRTLADVASFLRDGLG